MLRRTVALLAALVALPVVSLASPQRAMATFPGFNGKIVFQSNRSGTNEIYSVDASGGGLTDLTNGAGGVNPVWSPDGSKIAFIGQGGISIMNADGTSSHVVTSPPTLVSLGLSWSPDGGKLAYVASVAGTPDIWTVNVDGTGPTDVTPGTSSDYFPSWSPDGTRLAFRHDGAIAVSNPDGSGLVALTTPQNGSVDQAPSFSPDMSSIIFDRTDPNGGAGAQLWTVTLDASHSTTQLTTLSGFNAWPRYSPDRRRILFQRSATDSSGPFDLATMNPDGTNVQALASDPGDDEFPDWQPLAQPPFPSGPPTNVHAVASDASATVTWSPSAFGAPPQAYVVTASPGGATTTVPATATSTVISGLQNGSASSFSVQGDNVGALSSPAFSNIVVPQITLGTFNALPPARLLDTRSTHSPVGADKSIDVQATGAGGVPDSGVSAVVVNLTATNPTAGSYLTAYPTGGSPPLASNLNFGPGQTIPNLVTVKLGSGGKFSVYNAAGSTDVIADVVGWYSDGTTAAGDRFNALPPARILDTRTTNTPVGPNHTVDVQATGARGVPASGVSAVVVNLTATQPTAGSYLTAYPTGGAVPLASNLNFGPGQTIPNLATVKLSSDGRFSVYNAQGFTHVIADVVGWYSDGTTAAGDRFNALSPARILDTRSTHSPVGANKSVDVAATGQGGVPANGVSAVVVNLTATNPSAVSYLTAYPTGTSPPLASNLNFGPGQTIPNLVTVKLGTGGKFSVYNAQGSTDVIADVVGWFGGDSVPAESTAFQVNPQHTGALEDPALPANLAKRWTHDFGAQVSYPLVADGRVFATVWSGSGPDMLIYGLDATTGDTLWGPVDLGVGIQGSGLIAGSAYEGGRVFALVANGRLAALDAATGHVDWQTQLQGQPFFEVPPTAYGGLVFAAGEGTGGTAFAISEVTGEVVWTKAISGINSSPAVSATGTYFDFIQQQLALTPPTGALEWSVGEGEGGSGAAPVLFNGALYAIASPSNRILNAASGAQLGTFAATSTPAFSDSRYFFVNNGALQARDVASDRVLWTFSGDGTLSQAPLVVGDSVFIGGTSGALYRLRASDGTELSSSLVGAPIRQSMGEGGGLVVAPAGNTLVAFG